MGPLLTIHPKLVKLIPMLSSDNDGEALATVRAIGRTLKGAGLDWHDLTRAITAPTTAFGASASRPQPPKAKTYEPPPPPLGPPRWHSLTNGDRIMHLEYICYMGSLSQWERDFAKSIQALLEARPYAPLSPKQIQILDTLLAKEWEERR